MERDSVVSRGDMGKEIRPDKGRDETNIEQGISNIEYRRGKFGKRGCGIKGLRGLKGLRDWGCGCLGRFSCRVNILYGSKGK
jgi:hypothetical protein